MNRDQPGARLVVDASVVVKWHVQEVHSEAACRLLGDDGPELYVPELVFPEVGNILWKKVRRGDLTAERAREVAHLIAIAPLNVRASAPLMEAALEIALGTERTVYDSLSVALAVSLGCKMVTADKKLYNALTNGPLSPHILWIGGEVTAPDDPGNPDDFVIPDVTVPDDAAYSMSLDQVAFEWYFGFDSENDANDSDLERLGRAYGNVESLFLNSSRITDKGIAILVASLRRPEALRMLDLKGSAVTDAGLPYLQGLTGLGNLNLARTKITDSGLSHLQSLIHLRKLILWETGVSDAGLRHLQGLAELQELDLEGTRVTGAGVEGLRKALPSLVIKH